MIIARHVVALCLLVGGSLVAIADPPKVIKAVPDNGDSDVDPGLTEIRIEFDLDMSQSGHSICGGGPNFPDITGRPHWDGKRVIIVPVKLKPDWTYNLSVNCPAAQNTRSAAGEPAENYPITFTTRKAGNAAPAAPKLTPEQNRAAIDALRTAINDRYAYRDHKRVDWKKAFEEFSPKLLASESPAAFAREAAKLLALAKDLHNTLRVGEQVLATGKRAVSANADKRVLPKVVPEFTQINDVVWTGKFDDGVGYINITAWGSDDRENFDALYAALDKLTEAKGIIVDVRFNSGGDETLARDFASCFVTKKAVYSKNKYRDPSTADGWGPVYDRDVEPHKTRKPFAGRVALLIGVANMSSCESFILMMKTSPRVKLFGEKTYGSTGNPKPHDLGNGVTAVLSSWYDMTAAGTVVEDHGISPDVEVKTKPTDFASDDPVIKAAREWIAK
ncbi:MAG: S41 family peptidase [Phycisphaerae bacterium]